MIKLVSPSLKIAQKFRRFPPFSEDPICQSNRNVGQEARRESKMAAWELSYHSSCEKEAK